MIKIAFRIAAGLNFYNAAMLAKQHGFDGVELESTGDPSKTREIFAGSRIEISALNFTGLPMDLARQIRVIEELDCRRIRIKSSSFFSRSGTVTPQAVDFLMSAGDQAAEVDASILIENQPTFESAIRLWHLLDRLNHPAIGCCWNTLAAVQAGDAPAVAVPMLNSRIHYVQSPIDMDSVPIRKTIDRLRGIGFTGYLMIDCSASSTQSMGELEQALIKARSILQSWQILPTAVG